MTPVRPVVPADRDPATDPKLVAIYREVGAQLRLRGKAPAFVIFEATRQALGQTEEECGNDILAVVASMIYAGLIACNRLDPDGTIAYGADTTLAPIEVVLQ